MQQHFSGRAFRLFDQTLSGCGHALVDTQSFFDQFSKAPRYNAIVELFDSPASTRFSHSMAQLAVLHQIHKVICDVVHTRPIVRCPTAGEDDAVAFFKSRLVSQRRFVDPNLLRHLARRAVSP